MTRYLLLLMYLFVACENIKHTDILVIESKIIELKFDPFNIDDYTEGKFFYLDNFVVCHKKDYLKNTSNEDSIFLPTYNYVITQIEDKKISTKTNVFELSFILKKKLLEKNNTYQIVNLKKLETQGNLIIKRVDEKKIRLVFPKNYKILADIKE